MAPASTSPPPRAILTMVFVVGAASLGTEIAAARLLAPWFGASTVIWANTIATVLVALSAGYWLGGRIADRGATLRGLAQLIVAAAVLLAVVPFVSGPFLRSSVDAFDSLSVGAFVGSLVAVCVLIAVPVGVLGTVAPYAMRLSVTAVEEAGRVSGRLYATSTLGSRLAGVFAAALGLVVLLGLPWRYAAAPVACLALLALPTGTLKGSDTGRAIWERASGYRYAASSRSPTASAGWS